MVRDQLGKCLDLHPQVESSDYGAHTGRVLLGPTRCDPNLKEGVVTTATTCVLSCFSCVQLFGTLWTVARQAPLSIAFSRHEYWSGLPCPPPGGLPNPGMETRISEVSRTGRQVLYHCPAQSYGRLGPDNALLWGQPLQWRVLSSLPDLHPWMLVGHLSHF